jgi:predicted component of type VI protein secretion system
MRFSMEFGRGTGQDHSNKPVNGFGVVMLGTFSEGPSPSLHSIEVETIDKLLAKLRPSLALDLDGDLSQPFTLHFASVDDFHPDNLLDQLPDYWPTKSDDQSLSGSDKQALSSTDKTPEEAESQQETLSRLLGQRPLTTEKRQQTGSSLSSAKQSMIADVVRKLAENASTPELSDLADEASSDKLNDQDKSLLLKNLLHHKSFQRLESNWRSVDWLLHTIEPDPAIRCYLLDITRTELERERSNHQEPRSSLLFRLLRDALEKYDPLESDFILIDSHDYGPDQESLAMLDWLGSLVGYLNGTLVAEANSIFLQEADGSADGLKDWHNFRKRDSAKRAALLYPKILLRLPYGSATDPIQSQSFEELDEKWSLEELLWGNPAYAQVALVINQWARENNADQIPVLTDLPAYSYERDGEHHLQPCTQVILGEKQVEQLLNIGLVPVIGSRNRNTIQLPWFQYPGISNG